MLGRCRRWQRPGGGGGSGGGGSGGGGGRGDVRGGGGEGAEDRWFGKLVPRLGAARDALLGFAGSLNDGQLDALRCVLCPSDAQQQRKAGHAGQAGVFVGDSLPCWVQLRRSRSV